MQIYLPIADLPVNIFLVLGMGLAVGFISGMFGIGGGFLMTPLLIFVGISPAVAVASVASHIAASSMLRRDHLLAAATRSISRSALMLLAGGISRHRGRRLAVHGAALARPARSHHRRFPTSRCSRRSAD